MFAIIKTRLCTRIVSNELNLFRTGHIKHITQVLSKMLDELLLNLKLACLALNGFVGEKIGRELTVVRIDPSVLAQKSWNHVQPGYRIVRLNDLDCCSWDNNKAAKYLSTTIVHKAEFREPGMVTKTSLKTSVTPSGVSYSHKTRVEVGPRVRNEVGPREVRNQFGRIPTFKTFDFNWNNPCPFGCGYISLDVTEENGRCCKQGRFLREDDELGDFSRLLPINRQIEKLIMSNTKHFGLNSAALNNLFCIGTYANDKKNGTGLQKIVGDHCVTLNGRFHHILQSMGRKDPSGGIACFTMDHHTGEAFASLRRHAEKVNSFFTSKEKRFPDSATEVDVDNEYPLIEADIGDVNPVVTCNCVRSSSALCTVCAQNSSDGVDPHTPFVHRPAAVDVELEDEDFELEEALNYVLRLPMRLSSTDNDNGSTIGLDSVVYDNRLNLRIVELLYHHLRIVNRFCVELKTIGQLIRKHTAAGDVPSLRAELKNRVQFLEVGHIRSLRDSDDYVIMLDNSTKIRNDSPLLEPLCYPLLFMHGMEYPMFM